MRALIGIMSVLLAGTAGAQEVEGKALIAGRVVELLSDRTWRYADPSEDPAGDCDPVGNGLTFCGGGSGWVAIDVPNADVDAAYRHDDRHYGQFVTEGIGREDGMNATFIREVAIDAAGGPDAVTVLDVSDAKVADKVGETLVYAFEIDGVPVVYSNTIVSLLRRTFQVMTYAIGTEHTEVHRALHEEFLSLTEIE